LVPVRETSSSGWRIIFLVSRNLWSFDFKLGDVSFGGLVLLWRNFIPEEEINIFVFFFGVKHGEQDFFLRLEKLKEVAIE